MKKPRFDPYEWARNAQGDDIFSPYDIAMSAGKQITQLLKETDDKGVQEIALNVINVFATIVSDKKDSKDPEFVRAAMTRMYIMGAEAMRLAIIAETDNDAARASLIEQFRRDTIAESARNAIESRHNKPNGSRDKQEQMRAIWATGRYSSRDICAEQECAGLGMSFATARKALRNTPNPT